MMSKRALLCFAFSVLFVGTRSHSTDVLNCSISERHTEYKFDTCHKLHNVSSRGGDVLYDETFYAEGSHGINFLLGSDETDITYHFVLDNDTFYIRSNQQLTNLAYPKKFVVNEVDVNTFHLVVLKNGIFNLTANGIKYAWSSPNICRVGTISFGSFNGNPIVYHYNCGEENGSSSQSSNEPDVDGTTTVVNDSSTEPSTSYPAPTTTESGDDSSPSSSYEESTGSSVFSTTVDDSPTVLPVSSSTKSGVVDGSTIDLPVSSSTESDVIDGSTSGPITIIPIYPTVNPVVNDSSTEPNASSPAPSPTESGEDSSSSSSSEESTGSSDFSTSESGEDSSSSEESTDSSVFSTTVDETTTVLPVSTSTYYVVEDDSTTFLPVSSSTESGVVDGSTTVLPDSTSTYYVVENDSTTVASP